MEETQRNSERLQACGTMAVKKEPGSGLEVKWLLLDTGRVPAGKE